jgi:SAM-dependent methyltransferase
MPWYYAVAERDHDLQNPTSPEKIRHLGELLRLDADTRVLDIACGKAGPALVLSETFGCSIVGVERAPEFVAAARERIADSSAADRIEIVEADAAAFPLEDESWDVALCLGASFVFGGLDATLAALAPAVREGGFVAVGEPYWREWPLPREIADDEGFVTLPDTVARFEAAGLAPTGLLASSDDDWDRYESLHWRALEEWLDEHPDDPDAAEIRARHRSARDQYLRFQRALLGWAIVVGRRSG